MSPEIKIQSIDGKEYTSIDAVVNLSHGLCMRPSDRIADECKKYDKDVYFVKEGEMWNGKRIIDLLSLGAAKDTELTILVEGMDEEAETLALRLYSALSSEDSYNIEFENLEDDENEK